MKLYNHDICIWIHFYCNHCGREYKIQVPYDSQSVIAPVLINNKIAEAGHLVTKKEGDQYGHCKLCIAAERSKL